MIGVVERRPEPRREEPFGELLLVALAPHRPLIADPTGRHPPGQPFDDRATRRPRVALERRHGHRRPPDRFGDANPGVGPVESPPYRVGVVNDPPHQRLELDHRLRYHESVLGERAHVVVDVDDRRQLGTTGEAHGQVNVVAVAEDVDHLLRRVHLGLAESGQPFGQPVAALGQPTPDPGGQNVIVTGELGDDRQHRRGLELIGVEEHVHQLVQRPSRRAVTTTEPVFPRVDQRQQRADLGQKVERVAGAQLATDVAQQVGLSIRRRPLRTLGANGPRPLRRDSSTLRMPAVSSLLRHPPNRRAKLGSMNAPARSYSDPRAT